MPRSCGFESRPCDTKRRDVPTVGAPPAPSAAHTLPWRNRHTRPAQTRLPSRDAGSTPAGSTRKTFHGGRGVSGEHARSWSSRYGFDSRRSPCPCQRRGRRRVGLHGRAARIVNPSPFGLWGFDSLPAHPSRRPARQTCTLSGPVGESGRPRRVVSAETTGSNPVGTARVPLHPGECRMLLEKASGPTAFQGGRGQTVRRQLCKLRNVGSNPTVSILPR